MPELPEVEVVRAGVARATTGRTIRAIAAFHPRTLRRMAGGEAQLQAALVGRRVSRVERRGKFMWFTFAGAPARRAASGGVTQNAASDGGVGEVVLVVHLGMSGQLLVDDVALAAATRIHPAGRKHERAQIEFDDTVLHFVDQRTFGYLALSELVRAADGRLVPQLAAHIAPDALELSDSALARRFAGLRRSIKAALLDQSVVSGIGNIYADESLFAARINPQAKNLSRQRALRLAQAVQRILHKALAAGGTSFDALYVNAHGEAGYFDRALAVYGRAGQPCPRCGTTIVAEKFAGRHSHYCPHCQAR